MLEKEKRIRINAQVTLENIINKLRDIVRPDRFTRRDVMYAEMKYKRVLFNYIYDRPITEGFKKKLEEFIKQVERDFGYTIHKRLVDETIDIIDCIAYVKDPKELYKSSLLECIEPWNEDTGELAPEEFKGEFIITYPNAELEDENNLKRIEEWDSEFKACRERRKSLNKK